MKRIGLYSQLTDFTTENAGTAEWCIAERDGKKYFVKKFQSPIYPSKDIGLPEKMFDAGVAEFKETLANTKKIYQRLRECDQSGVLVVPVEVINYQFHICTIAEYVEGNVPPEKICLLSEWQRLVLMRTLTLALMNVHKAGIVHSDMRPDNVLISQDDKGHCKLRLIDFDGSFLETTPPTDSEEIVGDPAFFAPEAYRLSMEEDIQLDHRIDIFALGIIFHYFWCGKYPDKPSGQTIGECLLQDGSITFDESIPLVLKQLLNRMITATPENRLSLKSIYDVLGVQVGRYPPTVINLQQAKIEVPILLPECEKKAKVEIEKKAKVEIVCCDEKGDIIKKYILEIPYGTKKIVEAEKISGYHLIGLKTKEIVVDSKGFVVSPATFEYKNNVADTKKRSKKIHWAIILLWVLMACWGIMYLLCMNSYNNRDYRKAKQFMDLTPLFSTFFNPVYERTQQMVNRETSSNGSSLSNTISQEETIPVVYTGTNTVPVSAGEIKRVKYTAPSSGIYVFSTIGSDDTCGYLYSTSTTTTAIKNNDDGPNDKNFRIVHYLFDKETVYIGVKYYNPQKKGDISLNISMN